MNWHIVMDMPILFCRGWLILIFTTHIDGHNEYFKKSLS
jgi:hypothetical protein